MLVLEDSHHGLYSCSFEQVIVHIDVTFHNGKWVRGGVLFHHHITCNYTPSKSGRSRMKFMEVKKKNQYSLGKYLVMRETGQKHRFSSISLIDVSKSYTN